MGRELGVEVRSGQEGMHAVMGALEELVPEALKFGQNHYSWAHDDQAPAEAGKEIRHQNCVREGDQGEGCASKEGGEGVRGQGTERLFLRGLSSGSSDPADAFEVRLWTISCEMWHQLWGWGFPCL